MPVEQRRNSLECDVMREGDGDQEEEKKEIDSSSNVAWHLDLGNHFVLAFERPEPSTTQQESYQESPSSYLCN